MKLQFFRALGMVLITWPGAVFAADQCNNTAQCRTVFGPSATDCVDSASINSWCQCGTVRCDSLKSSSSLASSSKSSTVSSSIRSSIRSSVSSSRSSSSVAVVAKYQEDRGVVIMEVENTNSPLDKWIRKSTVSGYTGSGHLEFTGNNIVSGPPTSPLTYKFSIVQEGYYRLTMRAHKRLETLETDKSNDAYVRLEGDFGAGPNPGDVHMMDAPLELLKKNTKLFGGAAGGWGWTETLDAGGEDNKRNPVYFLKAGETYTLTVSGRSKNFNIDRILFYREDRLENPLGDKYSVTGARETVNWNETLAD